MLPEYLHFPTPDAAARPEQIVTAGNVRFTVLSSRLIRMECGGVTDRATLTVLNRRFDAPAFTAEEQDGVLTITTEHLKLTYRVGAAFAADTLSVALLSRPYTVWHYGEEPLQNLGGTMETLDRVNGSMEIAGGICSIDGYALIDDSRTALMDGEGWFLPREAEILDLYFFGYGHDYTAAVQDYYRLTGAPQMLPAYVLGNWWSRYHRYSDREYLALMDKFQEKDVPLSVGIVDMDWHLTEGDGREYWTDGWTGYTWNEDYFPDYQEFLKELKKRNLKTALNLHPALGVRDHEAQYEEMAAALDRKADGTPVYFDCLSPDFWRAYFEVLHFPYERDGVDFWWMDWQQGTDYAWNPETGENPLTCLTPLWMLNHMHYLAARRHGGRGFIFSRFAGLGSQRYPIGFSGDTVITWESLQFQPYFTVTATNIGYSWWSHDIGGHMSGDRDDELTTRWIQFGVFSPIFRLHSTANIFASREPWTYNPRAEAVMSDFMRLRHRLFPYLYTMCRRNAKDLIPLLRPMYHVSPEERAAYEVPNVYWFGDQMVAAPITERADAVSGLGGTDVWLPEGVWVDAFTGYVYRGGKFRAHRPLEQMPLFLKAGAIVPLQAHTAHENDLGGSERMELWIAAGGSGAFTLYEDDGETLAYEQGIYAETPYAFSWGEKTLTIAPVRGHVDLVPGERIYTLRFIGLAAGCGFTANGETLDAQYDAATNTYVVTLSGVTAAEGAVVTITGAALADDSDYYARIIDLLTRAQGGFDRKYQLKERLDKAIAKKNPDHFDIVSDHTDGLPSAMYEIWNEYRKARKE
ncbi:MAG: DUF5110 domain-containing protein [Ruminococcaceae bacterium]|nr:DUF5110 domain-containing protein [Oscillospiraceae bacterium]